MKILSCRGIFFDLGWTLLRPSSGDWHLTDKAREAIDPDIWKLIPPERLRAALAKANAWLRDEVILTEAEELDRFTHFYATAAESLPELKLTREQVELIACDKVFNDANYVLYDDAKSTLARLKKRYRLGVISDTWPSLKRVLTNMDIYDLFDNLTLSCELGVTKPHPKMYEHALRAMGLPARETVFIDDAEANLDGAAAFGIRPLLACLKPGAEESTRYPAVKKLSELLTDIE